MKINKILISQPAPATMEKSPFADVIKKHKVDADFVPFITVEGVSSKEFRKQRVDILAHTAVIFTSRKTIDSFFRICEECRVTIPEAFKYFCVTEAIALYLQKYIIYRKRKIFFGKGTFVDLMEIIVKHKDEKFLVALSEPLNVEIPKILEKTKIKHSKIILTRTVSSKLNDKVNISDYQLLVCYSPKEINTLSENFSSEILGDMLIATLGATTAKAANDMGLKISVLAPTKEFPSIALAIDNFITKYNKGEEIDTSYINESIKSITSLNEQVMAKVKIPRKKSTTKKGSTAKSGGSTTKAATKTTTSGIK